MQTMHAMVYRDGEPEVIPPDIKEQLHNFPAGWTRLEGVAHRSRHRMIANSWHMSVAIVVMALALQFAPTGAAPLPQQVTVQRHVGALAHVPTLGSPRHVGQAARARFVGHRPGLRCPLADPARFMACSSGGDQVIGQGV